MAKEITGEELFTIPDNEIWYTSTDGKIIEPYATNVFGANIVSNIYINGQGAIIFDAPVTSIEDRAFYNCESLTSIVIPDSVTSIGDYAFSDCTGLKSIAFGKGVTNIDPSQFSGCTGIESIIVSEDHLFDPFCDNPARCSRNNGCRRGRRSSRNQP